MTAFSSGSGLIPSVSVIPLDDGRKLDENPLRNPGLFIITAPVGSGKTVLILNLLMQMDGLYHNALWVSPNGTLDPLVDRHLKEDSIEFISDPAELHSRLGEIEATNRKKRDAKKAIERSLLVMDDCTADKRFFPTSQKNSLNHRLLSLRHLGVSAILVFHSYKMCPKVLRLNASMLFLFRCNELELKAVMEESRFPSAVVQEAYDEATDESPHGFLLLDLKQGRMYKNMETVLWEVPHKKKPRAS